MKKPQKARFAACTVKIGEIVAIGGTKCVVTKSEPSRYGTGAWFLHFYRLGDESQDPQTLCVSPNFPIIVKDPKK